MDGVVGVECRAPKAGALPGCATPRHDCGVVNSKALIDKTANRIVETNRNIHITTGRQPGFAFFVFLAVTHFNLRSASSVCIVLTRADFHRPKYEEDVVQLSPYLVFNGQCEAAFKFYEKALGGKIEAIMTFGDSPMAKQAPPEGGNKVVDARMTVGNTVLMGSDAPPDRYQEPQGFSLSISTKDPAEAERIFN